MAMVEELLTPAEVSERCKVSTKTVLRAIRAGRLRASRLGSRGAYRVRPADLEQWIETTRVEPEPQFCAEPVAMKLEPAIRRASAPGRLALETR